MRNIVITLIQNLGNGTFSPNMITVSNYQVISAGSLSWSIDEGTQLARATPGDITVTIADPLETVWAFVQSSLAITNGLYPPYLIITVDGTQAFLGIVDPSRIVRHLASDTHNIELGAQDWSIQLSNTYLGTYAAQLWQPSTAYTVGTNVTTPAGNLYSCNVAGTSATNGAGPQGQNPGTLITDGSCSWLYIPNSWIRNVPKAANHAANSTLVKTGYSPEGAAMGHGQGLNMFIIDGIASNSYSIGDRLSVSFDGGTTYQTTQFTVIQVVDNISNQCSPYTNYSCLTGTNSYIVLSGNVWSLVSWSYIGNVGVTYYGYGTATFKNITASAPNYYVVSVSVPANPSTPVYTINLTYIDGIISGDILQCVAGSQSASWTVMSVNPELLQITVKEAVTNLTIGDKIYFNDATQSQMVMTDARLLLQNAAFPYLTDLFLATSRMVQPTTLTPVFGWLPNHSPVGSDDLTSISDLEPTLTGIKLISGFNATYNGTPDLGWSSNALTATTDGYWKVITPNADWTNQLLSAPASLMPYEVRSLSPYARLRNYTYHDYTWLSVNNGPVFDTGATANIPNSWNSSGWSASIANSVPDYLFYDYIGMRKLKVTGSNNTLYTYAWSGSSFAGAVSLSWPSANIVRQLVSFPGGPAGSLLAYTTNGSGTGDQIELRLSTGSAGTPVAVPTALIGGQLVCTPYGPYLVGPTGYAQIVCAGSTLSVNYAIFPDQVSCLWPNTFCAMNATTAFCLGRLDSSSANNLVSQSWLFNLTMQPQTNQTGDAAINLSEVVSQGIPTFAGILRDPSKAGRLVGHLGGSVFQIDKIVSWGIERFTPSGLTAIECIEHICQVLNCVAVPNATGTINIISRTNSDTPTALTGIQIVKKDDAISWDNFFSLVLVETQDGKYYADRQGQLGGTLLSISGHPMIWSVSEAQAMADALSSWFGKPRATSKQTWTFPNASTATPWDSLIPFQLVTVNGSIPYRIMSLQNDYVAGTADVVLVQN